MINHFSPSSEKLSAPFQQKMTTLFLFLSHHLYTTVTNSTEKSEAEIPCPSMLLTQHHGKCKCLQHLLTSPGEAAVPHHQAVTCRGMEIRQKARTSS